MTSAPPSDGTGEGSSSGAALLLGKAAPRTAGIAGILFAVLFISSALVASQGPPEGMTDAEILDWLATSGMTAATISALYLAPFAGIAFLWFLGVVRDRIGLREDRFFQTVFIGSGLLFVAMYWSAAAQFASLIAGNRYDAAPPVSEAVFQTVRSVAFSFMYVLSARAASVFVLVTSTITWRTGTLPRPLVLLGYAIAVLMLFGLTALNWIIMLFPAWVLVVSVYVLVAEARAARTGPAPTG